MRVKDSFGIKIFQIINTIILTGLVVVTLYPVIHVVMASLSDGYLLLAHRGLLFWPKGFDLAAYETIFKYPALIRSYGNTIMICVITLILNILLTSFASYVVTRKEFGARNVLMMFFLFTMYFSGGMIPTYVLIKNLGLLNSFWSLILPASLSTYNMIVLRTSFASIPESLCESAKIDGASHFRILFQIVIPLSRAALSVIMLYYLVAQWNSWFPASLYIDDRNKYPLQLLLREILIERDSGEMGQTVIDSDKQAVSEVLKYAVMVVSTLPVLCIYPLIQKYFTKGVMIGAVKG